MLSAVFSFCADSKLFRIRGKFCFLNGKKRVSFICLFISINYVLETTYWVGLHVRLSVNNDDGAAW
jgi:hypothetical protein